MVSLSILTQLFQSVIQVYVCYGPWLYRPWGRSADGREADGGGGGDRDPWSLRRWSATMKLSLGWKGFDNFSSSENVFNPYCLNSFEAQKIFHFRRISLFACFMLSVFFDLNQHHLKDPWLEKHECGNRQLCQPSQGAFEWQKEVLHLQPMQLHRR